MERPDSDLREGSRLVPRGAEGDPQRCEERRAVAHGRHAWLRLAEHVRRPPQVPPAPGQQPAASAAAPGAAGAGGGGACHESSKVAGGGGSGTVILRMPTANYSGNTSGNPTVSTDGSDTIVLFNASGSYIS